MTSRPILFSAPMIRALLDGRKTQTRRIVKPQPEFVQTDRLGSVATIGRFTGMAEVLCPYGQPRDSLWVREAWGMTYVDLVAPDRPFIVGGTWGSPARPGRPPCVVFKADGAMPDDSPSETARWTPSIHMPRWASRLTLRITDVRVQRLQEISEADARAEGAPLELRLLDSVRLGATASHTGGFERLWESIHGPGSWAANPWVWALTFDVIRANVDEQKP